MTTINSTQFTRQIGEHLVAAKLGRLRLFATPFAGNVPEFDLVVANGYGQSSLVQVKAINGHSWQFSDARTFLNIDMVRNEQKQIVQVVKGKKKLSNPNLVCVFVMLRESENDEFYIFRLKDLQAIIEKHYKENLKSKNGVRPKNSESTHCAVSPNDLLKYRDNWPLVLESLA